MTKTEKPAARTVIADPGTPVVIPGLILPQFAPKWTWEGNCLFRETRIHFDAEKAFRSSWSSNKRAWLERGFGLKQVNGLWWLTQWLLKLPDGSLTLTQVGMDKLASLGQGSLALPVAEQPRLALPELPEPIKSKLYEYQVEPARQLLRALQHGPNEWGYPGAWDCSDMGTGKTFQALAAALATGLEVAVVCPLAVIPAWHRAFAHFGHRPKFVLNYESLRTGNREWVKHELGYSSESGGKQKRFRWQLDPARTCLIFDEAHNCKTPKSLNQAMLAAAARQRFATICVSGTLATDPTHMKATGRIVGLHKDSADEWASFLLRHNCESASNGYTTAWRFMGGKSGRDALARIHRTVFPARGARVRIDDLGDRFPETQIMAEPFETGETAAIAAAFKEAENILTRLSAQGASEGEIKMRRASAYMEAWHASERCKVPAIADMVAAELEAGRSVAIFVNFTDVREALMDRLKTKCAIFGGQSAAEREACIAEFQADKSRVIIANIDAGGVGVSLHDINGAHPRTAIILPTNKVVSLTQALGRVHRAGGKSKSRQIVMFAAGTIEEAICDTIRRRMAQITTINDGELYPEARF